MKKFYVYAIMTASKFLGEYEALNKDDAINKARRDENTDELVSLCHQWWSQVDVSDVYSYEAYESE